MVLVCWKKSKRYQSRSWEKGRVAPHLFKSNCLTLKILLGYLIRMFLDRMLSVQFVQVFSPICGLNMIESQATKWKSLG